MINIPTATKISLKALKVNKMRSGLTMLGVIIGVGSVITMLAVGAGAGKKISEQITNMGSNLLIVVPGATTASGVRMGSGTQPTLVLSDAVAIEKECSAVSHVAPEVSGIVQVVHRNRNWSTGARGTTASYLNVRDWRLYGGRPFTKQDIRSASKVCLLGQTVVENLFGGMNPIGKIIRIDKVPFQVIGMLERKGQSPIGHDQDDTLILPVTTAQKRLFKSSFPDMLRFILVKAKNMESLSLAENQITELLRQRHRIGVRRDDDFTVRNLTQIMLTAGQATRIMTLLLASIASISLLIGGIGIMNIMLVSVTERTKEVGIRMAVGAKRRDIRLQFMIEAIVISLIGGTIGVILGVVLSSVISRIVHWSAVLSPSYIILAFSVSGAVGLFFGYYPAHKASLLNPIDALRYE